MRLEEALSTCWSTLFPAFSGDVSQADAQSLLRRDVIPQRAVIDRISDDLLTLNSDAFEQHQADVTQFHDDVRRQMWWTSGLAVVLGLGIAIVAARHAGRLEALIRRTCRNWIGGLPPHELRGRVRIQARGWPQPVSSRSSRPTSRLSAMSSLICMDMPMPCGAPTSQEEPAAIQDLVERREEPQRGRHADRRGVRPVSGIGALAIWEAAHPRRPGTPSRAPGLRWPIPTCRQSEAGRAREERRQPHRDRGLCVGTQDETGECDADGSKDHDATCERIRQ